MVLLTICRRFECMALCLGFTGAGRFPASFFLAMIFCCMTAAGSGRVNQLVENIKNGPGIYWSEDAATHHSKTPYSASEIMMAGKQEKQQAIKSVRSAISLGDMGWEAREAIPALIEVFPRAVHVIVEQGVHYMPGQGSFKDHISTEVVSVKNKFLLAGFLIEYSTLVKCEQFTHTSHEVEFIEKRVGQSGRIVEALVNIYVTLTVNAGQCALARITGQDIGSDPDEWRRWWAQTGSYFTPSQSISSSKENAAISSGTDPEDIVEKGKYRLVLSTGDEFVGTVEQVDDTAIVIETINGEPYKFRKLLVVEYELLKLPEKTGTRGDDLPEEGINESEILTFEQLSRRSAEGLAIEVGLKNGSAFTGFLASINSGQLKLDVDGSMIPISKDAVSQISTVVNSSEKDEAPALSEQEPEGPFDTLIVRNPKTDEYGRALEDIVYEGEIISDDGSSIRFKTKDKEMLTVPYGNVRRQIRHRESRELSEIERYGKSLFCPEGMILVDIPPGKPGRPFFKVCIDKYEYPNTEGALPEGNVSYDEAQKLCAEQGKRLCTVQEWQWACTGLDGYTYPYGWNRDDDICNTKGIKPLKASGEMRTCVSKFGVYDMTGNIFEWVTGKNGKPMLMGGPLSKCTTVSPGVGGGAKPQTGFRCCKSN
ncbi:MAG: SUMF1/EgtB/PvdO family nonheme iron enzyme [Chitinivibrionales bacterium]|nr:SUMF1/EgtB/PvdO family nonheme iron enzyme [Chitinivibrionales bacterium]